MVCRRDWPGGNERDGKRSVLHPPVQVFDAAVEARLRGSTDSDGDRSLGAAGRLRGFRSRPRQPRDPGAEFTGKSVGAGGKEQPKSESEEKQDSYYLAERSYGAFERSVRLLDSIDEATLEAHFDKGVLKVIAQKRPESVKAERKIEIKKS